MKLELLPEELLVKIFHYAATEKRVIFNIASVNKYFRKIVDQYWIKKIVLNTSRETSDKKKIVEALRRSKRQYRFVKLKVSFENVKKFSLKKAEEKTQKWVNILELICEKFKTSITTLDLIFVLNDGCQVLQVLGALKKLSNLEALNLKLIYKKTDGYESSFTDYQNQAMEHIFYFTKLKALHFNTNIGPVCNLFKNCNSLIDLYLKLYEHISEKYYLRFLNFIKLNLKCLHIIDSVVSQEFIENLIDLEDLNLISFKFANASIQCSAESFLEFLIQQNSLKTLDLSTMDHVDPDFLTYIGKRLNLTTIEFLRFSASHGFFSVPSYDPRENFQLQNLKILQIDTKYFTFKKNFVKNLLTPSKHLTSLILNGNFELHEGSLFNISKNYPNLENLELGIMATIENNELYHIFRKLKRLKCLKFKFCDSMPLDIDMFKDPELILENLEHLIIVLGRNVPKINDAANLCVLFPNTNTLTIDVRCIVKNEILFALIFLYHMPKINYLTIIFNHNLPSNIQQHIPKLFEYESLQDLKIMHFPKDVPIAQRFSRDNFNNTIVKTNKMVVRY